jgi:hypothetical protein
MSGSEELPVINIITRTSNRPIFFGECQQSIQIQTYPTDNIKRYVTFDDEDDLDGYIQNYNNLIVLEVDRQKRKNQSHFPYNNYINDVLEYIEDGWVMILDDDDLLSDPSSLDVLSQHIINNGNDPEKFFIWKCQVPGRTMPSESNFGKSPKSGDIRVNCFAFHHSKKNLVKFDTKRQGEFKVVSTLFSKLNCVWIDEVLTQINYSQGIGGNGTREDKKETLIQEAKKKISLKKKLPVPFKTLMPESTTANVQSQIVDEDEEEEIGNDEDEFEDGDLVGASDDEEELIGDDEGSDEDDYESDEEDIVNEEVDQLDSDEEEIVNEEPEEPEPEDNDDGDEGDDEHEQEATESDETVPAETQAQVVPIQGSNANVIRLVNMLGNGQNVYILDENNMYKLSKCLTDAAKCVEISDKLLTRLLEKDGYERKYKELEAKLARLESGGSTGSVSSSKPSTSRVSAPAVSSSKVQTESQLDDLLGSYQSKPSEGGTVDNSESSVSSYIDKIYVLTDDNGNRNNTLKRNIRLLNRNNYDYEVVLCRDMTLFNYQNQIRELLIEAKNKAHRRIMILNGNDLFNKKFPDLLEKQLKQITGDCHLWFLGESREISQSEFKQGEFVLEDYLLLYDDIVNARMTTEDRAHKHWKTYGYREARHAKIGISNGNEYAISNNYGFVVSAEVYDVMIDVINKQHPRQCEDVLVELQSNVVDVSTIWLSKPDLIIPKFRGNNVGKNKREALSNGWYYNFYTQ